jgi:hypothetical protein
MKKTAEFFGGFPHFMWLFSRDLALLRTLYADESQITPSSSK